MKKQDWIIFIEENEEKKAIRKTFYYVIIICGCISLTTLFLLPVILDYVIWGIYIMFLDIMWLSALAYISYIIGKTSKIKEIVYFVPFFAIFVIVMDLTCGQFLGWYEIADEFFKIRFDMLSHFFAGVIFFLIITIILTLFNTKYRIENTALVLTNFVLFLYELLEETIEFVYGDLFQGLQNKFFWNSIQDIIFNFIGSFLFYLILRRYLRKRLP